MISTATSLRRVTWLVTIFPELKPYVEDMHELVPAGTELVLPTLRRPGAATVDEEMTGLKGCRRTVARRPRCRPRWDREAQRCEADSRAATAVAARVHDTANSVHRNEDRPRWRTLSKAGSSARLVCECGSRSRGVAGSPTAPRDRNLSRAAVGRFDSLDERLRSDNRAVPVECH